MRRLVCQMLGVLLLLVASVSSGADRFDIYGGYRGIRSARFQSYTGTSTRLKAYRLVDSTANFPPNGLVGSYLHPKATQVFIPLTKQTKHLEVLRYRITKNTRTEIFTDPGDGKLTQYAHRGDAYKTSRFFTVEKVGSRWWYMTPEGHAFIALSVSGVNSATRDGQDKSGKTYGDYVKAKYAGKPHFRANWANATLDRLHRWGFNTIGTFSHKVQTEPHLQQRLPYVVTLRLSNKAVIEKAVGNLWEGIGGGKFPDLWHPDFESYIDKRMQQVASAQMVRDPYILYLFPDQADELRGIGQHHYSLGWAALAGKPEISGHPNYTKQKLRDMLREKYGEITRLNAAWKTTYTTWDSDGGYPNGRGFLDQGKGGIPGPTHQALDHDASPVMREDLHEFVELLFQRYAQTITSTIRKYDPHHLITTPNSLSLEAAVKAFDGYFDVFWSRESWVYDVLQHKRPLATSSLGYLTADRDSPLRLEGWLAPQFEVQVAETQRGKRHYLKVWDAERDLWFNLQGKNPLRIALFDENMQMLDFGKNPGNQYDILQTGNDTEGGWMLLRSRGYRTGKLDAIVQRFAGKQHHALCRLSTNGIAPRLDWSKTGFGLQPLKRWLRDTMCHVLPAQSVSRKIYYRRRGFGNLGPGGFPLGFDTQEARAHAWEVGLHRDLTERAANGDYFRIGANWWKFADNGWTYWLERYNFGLVTLKDNAYDGHEATTLGADGQAGTPDDEADDYGDLLTGVTRTNTELYDFLQQHDTMNTLQQ